MTAARLRRHGDWLLTAGWPLAAAFSASVIAVWQWAALRAGAPAYLVAPTDIAAAAVDLFQEGVLVSATLRSLSRLLPGFLIGSGIGVLLGLVAGVSRWSERVLDVWVSTTYPLPKIALFPVFVIWLGYSDEARILVIAVTALYPSFVNALVGTRQVDPALIWSAKNFGASRPRIFGQVVTRAAMPSIVVGVRISLAIAFTMTFATEAVGAARDGLSFVILDGFYRREFTWMFVGVLVFGLLGYLADRSWVAFTNVLLRGQRTTTVAGAGRG